jgi:hypothetical protein
MQFFEFIHGVLVKVTGRDVGIDTMVEELWTKMKEARNNIIISLGLEDWYYLL